MVRKEIRYPKIESFGVHHPHGLLNILQLNTRPGYEKATIEEIDSFLMSYRKRIYCNYIAQQQKTTTQKISDDPFNGFKEYDKKNSKSLFSRAVHATLLGRFQQVAIFKGTGFGQNYSLSSLKHITASQVLLGGPPVPLINKKLESLQTNPDLFLVPYNHNEAVFNPDELPKEVCSTPLLSICQLQIRNILKNTAPCNITLPLLYTIDKKITSIANNEPIEAMLIDAYEWCDFVLLIKNSNIENTIKCVDAISNISLTDIIKTWDELENYNIDGSSDVTIKEQKNEMVRRFTNILDKLNAPFSFNTSNAMDNSIFSATVSIPGILWPCAHYALMHAINTKEKQPLFFYNTYNGYCKFDIKGNIFGNMLITNENGYCKYINEILLDLLDDIEFKGNKESYMHKWLALGNYDKIIPASSLDELLSPGEFHHGNNTFLLKDFIWQSYYLRWLLLAKRTCSFSNINNKSYDLPWLNDLYDQQTKEDIFIRDMGFDIQGIGDYDKIKDRKSDFPLISLHKNFVSKLFGNNEHCNNNIENLIDLLLKRGVSRNLRDIVLQALSLWRRKLLCPQDFGNMIELSDAYLTWINSLNYNLKNDVPVSCIEEQIRFFCKPFIQALKYRSLASFYMEEMTDFNVEFRGGLYNMITNLDGLVKAVFSLVAPPYQIGGISLIDYGPMASIKTMSVSCLQGNECFEYICATNKLNYLHMVHPTNASSVIHELLHVITLSKDFISILKLVKNGETVLSAISSNDDNNIEHERIQEILVDYILGWLIFDGRFDLFCKSFLIRNSLNNPSYSNDELKNKCVLTEYICRCFLLDKMLNRGKSFDWDNDFTEKGFSVWWEKYWAFVLNDSRYKKEQFEIAIKKTIIKWKTPLLISSILTIIKATELYFSSKKNDSRFQPGSKRSFELRKDFISCLRKLQKEQASNVANRLSCNNFSCNSMDFIFHQFDEDKNNNHTTLRIRRLESLISFIMLIRGFYTVLFDGEFITNNNNLWLHVHNKFGGINYSNTSNSNYLLYREGGTLFCLGQDSHRKYVVLREAFLKSMWNISEVMKYSNIVSLSEMASKSKEENTSLFFPNDLFIANDINLMN